MITVITGAVKAGKSKKLIECYNLYKEDGVLVFSSKFSLSNGEEVKSRYGTQVKSVPINTLLDIIPYLEGNKDVKHILIDEFQFLEMEPSEVSMFVNRYSNSYDFHIFGLNMDYKAQPFSLMATIMSMADEVYVIKGYCDRCKSGDGKYSLRLENGTPANIGLEGELIVIDGTSKGEVQVDYQTICDDCWHEIYKDVVDKPVVIAL